MLMLYRLGILHGNGFSSIAVPHPVMRRSENTPG